jgi:hypothetical protein
VVQERWTDTRCVPRPRYKLDNACQPV